MTHRISPSIELLLVLPVVVGNGGLSVERGVVYCEQAVVGPYTGVNGV